MQTTLDCMPCFVRQALGAARMVTDDLDSTGRMLREVLWEMSQMSTDQSPVVMAQRIHRLVRRLAGDVDPYREIKTNCNRMAMEFYPELAAMLADSIIPLEVAIRLAIAGNAIDLGVHQDVDKKHISDAIRNSLKSPLEGDVTGFIDTLSRAESILYLADNAGEIVFDRLLIEQIGPERITLAVRGVPVLNDATLADAESLGLTDLVEVIDNGSDAPGTLLYDCSDEFLRRFEQADMVIAKGQGNYESLNDTEREVYLLLQAKCPVIAARLGLSVSSLVITRGGYGAGDETKQIQQDLHQALGSVVPPPEEVRSA
ncbi:MAG: DUF89 family protein [Phycisphaerales bacterium]|jgi:damage-control phosphatase, subfamily I|nr:DUF89 family protein [Phycisphaerales bacterium]